jgi:hypothetical protein
MANALPIIDLTDPTLFGNDAAEDELAEVFDSYFVSRPEVGEFLAPKQRLGVLRAYRGEGKSAVLRKGQQLLSEQKAIVTRTTGAALSPALDTVDPGQWTRGWQRAIFSLLAAEIGSRIGMAWSDDAMSLVEESEKNGFKSRSLFSSVFDRIKASSLPVERTSRGAANAEKIIQRWLKDRTTVWVFVDDVDENYQNTAEFRARVAGFFSACRHITNLVPEVRIRAGIRPNVWSILKADAESLSKVEQYVHDLRWDMEQLRTVLARRIEGYLQRSGQDGKLKTICDWNASDREEKLISFAFQESMPWGYNASREQKKFRPPHVVMSTLSRLRPRWMIELAKAAAKGAKASGVNKIGLDQITGTLAEFGRHRIADLSSEYSSVCPQLHEIINAFADQAEQFTTADLHTIIQRRVLQGVNVSIVGTGSVRDASRIAALLYEIGFLTAREDLADGTYRHFTFAELPDLLHSKTNRDRGMSWEIHPVFRQALGLRSPSASQDERRGHDARRRRR